LTISRDAGFVRHLSPGDEWGRRRGVRRPCAWRGTTSCLMTAPAWLTASVPLGRSPV